MNRQKLVPDIGLFVRTLELGTFAAVADETGLTSSGVSRVVTRLENRLGVKLLYRSTRRLVLTPEGETFLAHAQNILSMAEAAEADVSAVMGRPRGHLRVNSGSAFARHKLAPYLPRFLEKYPDVTVEVLVSDQRIDPIEAHADVTIRVGPLADSDLIGMRLGTVKRIITASPEYIAQHGTPKKPNDLLQHNCLLLNGFRRQAKWPMFEDDRRVEIAVGGSVTADNADVLLDMAIAGVGIIRLGDFLGEEAFTTDRLIPLLEDCHDNDPQPITVLISPERLRIPRIRAFVDFLKTGF